MPECSLWKLLVVERLVTLAGDPKVFARAEMLAGQDLTDAAVEAIDHPVSLRVARIDQMMLDTQQHALAIERVLIGRFFRLAGEAVSKLTAVARQQFHNFHRRTDVQTAQELGSARFAFVDIDAQVEPARGTVGGHRQVAPRGLIGHLRQVLDADEPSPAHSP